MKNQNIISCSKSIDNDIAERLDDYRNGMVFSPFDTHEEMIYSLHGLA